MKPFVFDETNTFCITLDHTGQTGRWTAMTRRFAEIGLSVTKWRASTVSDLTDTFAHYLNDGQRGCAQSHIQLYRHIIEHNLEYAFILEDDALFDLKWRDRLAELYEAIDDPEWDMVVLNGSEPIEPAFRWTSTEFKEQYLTAGYVISKKGAESILRDYGHCFCASDWMTSRLQLKGHSYCYFPWLIIQEGKESTIGSNCEGDHAKVVRCLGEIGYPIENYQS
jgi:GR25 family glycosyltransferase involved in LPS biosynthesis